ncbi:MAG: LamG-like jellyroll fold domain-containing protein, partial [Actinomycetota bacterium]
MSDTLSPLRRTMLRVLLAVAIIATVLPLSAAPAFAAGNNAVQLDGADDAIDLGTGPASPLGATNFTLELWFKRTGTGAIASTGSGGATSIVPLISKGRSEADGTTQDTNYMLGISTITGTGGGTVANSLAADFEDRTLASNNNSPVFGTTAITMNVWHHAAATFNGSQFCLYLDGVLDGTCRATTLVPTFDSTQKPAIGTAYDSNNVAAGRFLGQVDEARIWNVARTQAQIQGSMNAEIVSPVAGLLGRWGMNEGTGITAANTAGSAGVNGTLVGPTGGLPTWVSDAAPTAGNNAVQLDGADDAIDLGTGPASPLGATNFTLELWFKRTGTGAIASTGSGGATSIVPLISKGRSEADGTTQDTNYMLGISTITGTGGGTVANSLAADFEDRTLASNNNSPVFGTTAITMNVWHHAAATFNGSQFCLYLDGVLDGTCRATTLVPTFDSTQKPAIGTAYDSNNVAAGRFLGQVDEARIWNVARTQAQIQGSMNAEIVSPVAGLLGRWGMNEGTGITAANTAGSAGVNGTLVGPTGGLPTWANGAPVATPPPPGNYAVQFDGTDDQIDLGTASASTLGASQYTLELWFKKTGAGIPAQTSSSAPGLTSVIPLITKGRSEADGTNVDINYFLGIDTVSGKLATDFEEGATGASPGLNHGFVANTVITNNVWHHAAVTYDGSVFRIYLDGTLDGTSAPINQPPRSDSAHKVGIGVAFQAPPGNAALGAFQGQVDEVRIWNTARSLAQIQGAMGSEITTGQANLLGRWGLNEGFSNFAGGTGTAVNGTLVNGPTWVAGTTFTPPNTAPVVDSVVINQATPRTNDTLTVTVTSHDPEGNPVTYAYQWTNNGTDISGANSATLDLATPGNGDKDDVIRARVTASDASLTSSPVTSAPVTVLNTVPTATVSLDDHTPGTNATLTATATAADDDGDVVTLTYVWKVNGVTQQTTPTTS